MRSRLLFADKQKKLFDSPKIKKQMKQPSILCSPKSIMDQSEFNYQYSQFTMDLPINQEIRNNIKYLYELYCQMCQLGGLANVISTNKMKVVIAEMSNKFPQMSSLSVENVVEHYIKSCLFSFQIVLKTNKKIQNDKLACLMIPKFIQKTQISQNIRNLQKGIKLFDDDIVVLCNLCENIGLAYQLFNVTKLCQNYSQQFVNVTIQCSDESDLPNYNCNQTNEDSQKNSTSSQKKSNVDCVVNTIKGFSKLNQLTAGIVDTQCFLEEQRIQINFKQFIQYFNGYPFESYEERHKLLKLRYSSKGVSEMKQKVLYVSEFDAKGQFFINQIFKRVDGTIICYKQSLNLLQYADQDIAGVTLPNFSIKINSSREGGKQQIYGMAKIDINFGPDSVEWYCLAPQNIAKFYEIFKTEYGIIIDRIEGQWFENLDWFIQRKIPIKRLLQKKGDAVIIGSGSLYWNKSLGKSLHAYWNILPKTEKQIVVTTNKSYKSKQQISKLSANDKKVHIKSILLKALNHEEFTNGERSRSEPTGLSSSSIVIIREALKKWYIQQEKYLNQMIAKQLLGDAKFTLYHLFDAESYCNVCQTQILMYFTNNNGLNCMECTAKCLSSQKLLELTDKTIYFKNDVFWLYQLIYYGNIRTIQHQHKTHFPEFQELCQKQFIYNIQNCQKQLKKELQSFQIIDDANQWSNLQKILNQQLTRQNIQAKLRQKVLKTVLNSLQNNISKEQLTRDVEIQTQLRLLDHKSNDEIAKYLQIDQNQHLQKLSSTALKRIQARKSSSQVSSENDRTSDTQFRYQSKKYKKQKFYSRQYVQKGPKRVKRDTNKQYHYQEKGEQSGNSRQFHDQYKNYYDRGSREREKQIYGERRRSRSKSRGRGRFQGRGLSREYQSSKYRGQEKYREKYRTSEIRKNNPNYHDYRN